jgi:predicted nuclease with TOPRIM domain
MSYKNKDGNRKFEQIKRERDFVRSEFHKAIQENDRVCDANEALMGEIKTLKEKNADLQNEIDILCTTNSTLGDQIASLKSEIDSLVKDLNDRNQFNENLRKLNLDLNHKVAKFKRFWENSFRNSIERGKKLAAIQLILDGDWELDPTGDEIKIVKAPEKKYVIDPEKLRERNRNRNCHI